MPVDDRKIDESVLLPIALEFRKRLACDPEKWHTYEIEQIRLLCGPQWASMPVDNIKRQLCNLRKRGKLGTVNGGKNHGQPKREPKPTWYTEVYLHSSWWKEYRLTILKFWGWRCAICNRPATEVHHRTYDRCKTGDFPASEREQLTDCVALCRRCHKAAHRSLGRDARNEESGNLFPDAE